MKVKYMGPNIGVTGLTNDKVYNVVEVDPLTGALRIIDDDQNDFNFDNDPDWKPGYLYSPTAPRPIGDPQQSPGRFIIIEDDDQGSQNKAING